MLYQWHLGFSLGFQSLFSKAKKISIVQFLENPNIVTDNKDLLWWEMHKINAGNKFYLPVKIATVSETAKAEIFREKDMCLFCGCTITLCKILALDTFQINEIRFT